MTRNISKVRTKEFSGPRSKVLQATRSEGEVTIYGDREAEFGHRVPRCGCVRDDGVYAGWRTSDGTVEAYTDRYGAWPLFYSGNTDHLLLSDSLTSVAAHLPGMELDKDALACFFRIGFFLGESTPFKEIKILPPGGRLEWHSELNITGEKPAQKAHSCNHAEAIDGYIDLFRQAMHRLSLDVQFMPLSGGRDSRHIFFEMCRQKVPPQSVISLGGRKTSPESDAAVARQLAERLNVPHVVVTAEGSRFMADLAHHEATHLCCDEHSWMVPLFAFLTANTDAYHDGIAGDALSAGLFLSKETHLLYKTGRLEAVADAFLDRCRQTRPNARYLDSLYGIGKGDSIVKEELVAELRRHEKSPNPVSSFYFWNRTRRGIALAPFGLGRGVAKVLAPYLDADLFDFLASLSAEIMWDRTFHSETIEKAFPEHADIPYASGSTYKHHSNLARRVCDRTQVLRHSLENLGAREAFEIGVTGKLGRGRAGYVCSLNACLAHGGNQSSVA